jgi:hypothetical protein
VIAVDRSADETACVAGIAVGGGVEGIGVVHRNHTRRGLTGAMAHRVSGLIGVALGHISKRITGLDMKDVSMTRTKGLIYIASLTVCVRPLLAAA